jgi:uncharacterized membrane protein
LSIQSNRTLGGIGACFTVVGAVSSVFSLVRFAYPNSTSANLAFGLVSGIFGLIGFVGFLLFLIAMYGFSKSYGEHRIFNYILYGIIISIIAAVIVGAIAIVIVLSNFASIFPNINSSTTMPNQITDALTSNLSPVFSVIGFVGFISIVFNVKAFNLLADKSQVPLFRTAAKVLLAGGLVTIVLGIVFAVLAAYGSVSFDGLLIISIPGGLVQDVAWVLLAMAFFRINPTATQTITTSNFTSPNQPPVAGQVKYCTHCGTPNQLDATYCTRCGQRL